MMKNISFCQTCRNRLWQLKETLPQNLRTIGDDCELVLVDYGSTDGMASWVWENHKADIESGKLVLFEVRNKVRWSCPRAKNLAHRLATSEYLFNLDADNFVTDADLQMIGKAVRLGVPCQQWSGDWVDGSYGRIGFPKKMFFALGGYDETLLPMGGQDSDILLRLMGSKQKYATLGAPGKAAIANSFSQKMAQVGSIAPGEEAAKSTWKRMELVNQNIAQLRLETEGPVRLDGFQTFQGLLNGKMIIIDGMN